MRITAKALRVATSTLIAWATLLSLGAVRVAAAGVDGTVLVTLDGGVPPADLRRDDKGNVFVHNAYFDARARGQMVLRLVCRNGEWDADASGVAKAYNLGLHLGDVTATPVDDGVRLVVALRVRADKLGGSGGSAEYRIDLRPGPGGELGGTFSGRFANGLDSKGRGVAKSADVAGRATARVEPHWPVPMPGRARFSAGEHPRLLFRKADLPALRERAATPAGKAVIEQMRTQLAFDKSGRFEWGKMYSEWAPPYCEGWWASGHGFLYALDGDKAELAEARRVTQLAMDFKGGEWGGWGRAPNLVGIALAYDLCYDGWDADFRQKVAAFLSERAGVPEASVDGAWDAMFNAAGALAALAIAGDPEDVKGAGAASIGQIEHFLYWYDRLALGECGFMTEAENTTDVLHNLLPLLHAYQTALAADPAAGTAYEWVIPLVMHSNNRFFHADWGDNFWRPLGFPGVVRDEYKPALRWQMKQFDDPEYKKYPQPWGARLPMHCGFALVGFPWDAPDVAPKEWRLPLALEDREFGGYCFRSGWDDRNDVTITFRAQQNAPRYGVHAGTFTVDGLGVRNGRSVKDGLITGGGHCGGGVFTTLTLNAWEERPNVARVAGALPMGGGRVTYSKVEADGSGAVTMAQDLWVEGEPWGPPQPWGNKEKDDKSWLNAFGGRHAIRGTADLGVRHTRAFAVDYSRKCGSAAMVVVVDRFSGAPERAKWAQYTFHHGLSYERQGESQFRLSKKGRGEQRGPALAHGTFILPAKVSAEKVYNAGNLMRADGSNFYFLIMTLDADGTHADPKILGGQQGTLVDGVDAKAMTSVTAILGDRTVRFDGEKIVLGDRQRQ